MAVSKAKKSKVRVARDYRAVFSDMYERGFTDGLPVIPPTEARVREILGQRSELPMHEVEGKLKEILEKRKAS